MERLLSKMLIGFFVLFLLACNSQKSGEGSIMVFNIDQAGDQINFDVGELFSSGHIVRLESKPEAMIGRISALEVADNYIVIYNQGGRILLFDHNHVNQNSLF